MTRGYKAFLFVSVISIGVFLFGDELWKIYQRNHTLLDYQELPCSLESETTEVEEVINGVLHKVLSVSYFLEMSNEMVTYCVPIDVRVIVGEKKVQVDVTGPLVFELRLVSHSIEPIGSNIYLVVYDVRILGGFKEISSSDSKIIYLEIDD